MALLLDIVIVGLLIAALANGMRLHQGMRRLRQGDSELHRLIQSLDQAVDRAGTAIDRLRQSASQAEGQLAGEVVKVQRLIDDLKFLSERGEQLADRLEADVRGSRGATTARPARTPAADTDDVLLNPMPSAKELSQQLRALR